MEGAGVRLVRSIATSELDHVDPAGQCCGPFWASLPAALHQGWIDRTRAEFREFEWLRTAAAIAGLIIATILIGSWVLHGPGVNWHLTQIRYWRMHKDFKNR